MEREAVPNSSMRIPVKKDFSIFSPVFTFILMTTPTLIPIRPPTSTAILMELLILPYLLLAKGSGLSNGRLSG